MCPQRYILQLYVAFSLATNFRGVRVVAVDQDDKQRVFKDADSDSTRIFTLNIVDRALLASANHSVDLCTEPLSVVPSAPCASNSIPKHSRYSRNCLDCAPREFSFDNADCGEPALPDEKDIVSHGTTLLRSSTSSDDLAFASVPTSHFSTSSSRSWGNRYFETQDQAGCGQHALNNLLGGPQFTHDDLVLASTQILAETGDDPIEHVHYDGWYSHGVLATALQNTVPPRWRLLLNALLPALVFDFLHDATVLGALVNVNDAHWIAYVKHAGCSWLVDSKTHPVPLSEADFLDYLCVYPCTYPLEENDSSF